MLDLRFINQNTFYSVELVHAIKLSGDVSSEFKNKRSAHYCLGTVKASYWESFREMLGSTKSPEGKSDMLYELC